MATEVVFNADRERYEITVDGEFAGHVDALAQDGAIELSHTVVLEKFSGQGLAKILVRGALDDLRARGLSIVPICPFVIGFVEKNPEYQDLVK